ncbi:myoneurin-like [Haliotis rufescens]|uniref:myoneurin-like n=1 Tax=Haliotis rufescens TaxID=6454 RepID=UPI001EB0759D|nr:myoneurin-like [Haliotis rufescens]
METGSLDNEDPSLVNVGMASMAANSMDNMAASRIDNMAAARLDNMAASRLDNIVARGLDMNAGGYDGMVNRGYDTLPTRSLDSLDPRGMSMATRDLNNMASSGMNGLVPRSIESMSSHGLNGRSLDITASRSGVMSRQSMDNMSGQSINNQNMDNISGQSMNMSNQSMDNMSNQNMDNMSNQSMDNMVRRGVDNMAVRSVNGMSGVASLGGEVMAPVDRMAVQRTVYESRTQMSQVPQETSEEMTASKFAERVNEIVQNLEENMDDNYSDRSKKEDSSGDDSQKSSSNVATKFVHIIDDHSENFRHQLHQQWLKGQHCDLVVKVKDKEFKVHSCVLAAFSPVLCHLKKNMSLCIPEVDHAAITPLIKMMYTGILCFDLAVAPFVAMAAKRLMLSDIYTACEDYITQCHKSGLEASDVHPDLLATGGVQVTIKKYGMEGYNAEYSRDKSTQMSEDEQEFVNPPIKRRGRPRRRYKKKYAKRGRPPKIKIAPVPSEPRSDGEVVGGDGAVKTEVSEEKVTLQPADDEDEEVNIEDEEDVEDEEEYIPDEEEKKSYESRRRMWPHKKNTAVMKWLMGRRKQKIKPKHTKRDKAGKLKCPGCTSTFETSDDLQNHIETSSEHNAFRCTQCGVAYIRKSNLTRHMRTVHSNAFHLKCRSCNIVTKTERELRNHCLEVHNNNSPFECEEEGCNYRTYKYDFLRRHKQIHSEQRDYVCDKCGKTFSQQAGLLSHHRTCYHLQEYLCDVCGQAFNHYQSMKSHRRSIHYGERPFMCTDCGTRFSDHRNLKRHRRIHENAFPYSCQICGQKYRHSNSLKAHMKKHSDVMSAEAAATTALISSYTNADVEMSAQYSHPPPPLPLPPMPLNHLHEYYANACDKYVPMTSMSSVVPQAMPVASHPNPTTLNSTVNSVGLDTLADLCLSSSVV